MNSRELFNNTVFFLGAGASRHAGCMTSADMLSDLRTRINQLNDEVKKQVYTEIYRFLSGCLQFQHAVEGSEDELGSYPLNIEDFVRILRQIIHREFVIPGPLIGTWNEKIIRWELRTGPTVFQDLLALIVKLIRTEWTFINRKKLPGLLSPIRKLLSSTELDKIDFFTLNYDRVFEEYFNTPQERLLENGFDGRHWTGNFTDVDQQKESKINLFKLHGSLDWWYNSDDEVVELRWPDNAEPLIVFGTDNKMHSIAPFLDLLTCFRSRLKRAALLVTIGYSFFDPYVNNVLIHELSRSPRKRILVIDPKYKKKSPTDFLDHLAKLQLKNPIQGIPNLSKISPEKVKVFSLRARDFFKTYLANGGSKLWQEYERVKESTTPF